MSDVLDQLHDDLSRDLHRIKKRFKPGVKVTLVIRRPDNVEADVVIGDDDLNETIATIQRRFGASPHGAAPPCSNTSPRWFTGHWRDWHRGHGCDKDDGKPQSMGAALEIAANGGRRG